MPDKTGDLFDDAAAKPRGRTFAPETLSPPEIRQIHGWAEKTIPWVSRGAFESFTTLDQYIEEVLEWWGGEGGKKMGWVKTIQNRIRTVERGRLARIAARGNDEAAAALRQPREWALLYDRKARATAIVVASSDEGGKLIRPEGGQVIRLQASGER